MKKISFTSVLDEFKDSVFNYAVYILHNREDAEDVTQEVFVRLWKNRDAVKYRTRKAWLMKVTYNRCMDLLRKKKSAQSAGREALPIIPDLLQDPDPSTNPEKKLHERETSLSLQKALDILPDQTKSIFLLHYFQGCKYREIGDILDLSESAVKIAIHRGKKRLRKELAADLPLS